MPVRTSEAEWRGNLRQGNGEMTFGKGAFAGNYSFSSRFEEGEGTNPEELLAAAHAACFSMALSAGLADAGFPPDSIRTRAHVHIDRVPGGFEITRIELETEGAVPGIDEGTFRRHAEATKASCPVSKALKAVPMTVSATLR